MGCNSVEQQKVERERDRERENHLLFKFKTIITSNHSKVSLQPIPEEEEEEDDRHQPAAWLWNVAAVKT